MDNRQSEWDSSYQNRDNFVFYPHEEVIRFVSRHIRKRIGMDEYRNIIPSPEGMKMLDLGCGIGRHVIYGHEIGLDAYGIDLSETAVKVAREWAGRRGIQEPESKILQGDVRHLPWEDDYFDFSVSHGVLDSMPFKIAQEAIVELARVMKTGALFYCDLISGDDSSHAREYAGEEEIKTQHEQGTIQSYFNFSKITSMVGGLFEVVDCNLIHSEEVLKGFCSTRYHLVLRRL